MFAVDTNILVPAANVSEPASPACRTLVERWRMSAAPWFVTWSVLYEFMRVVTHRRFFAGPWTGDSAWEFVEALLASPSLQVLVPTERHAAVAAEVVGLGLNVHGNIWHDAHIAILMREHGIRTIYTQDMDFHRFPFLEVIDPTV